ncbi:glycosyltransferase involved in cell wall biosynthesis [Pseudochelatococcus lubricantis]|uniref:Glycosyltransferase involved in cell wall biosynthesis n=1 Tax=Pseudochelatococcus lubricantis TaxID=1538102 RepID=A0ABX0V396_9HYPH|nr:glycosyltransferase involved in cell wall biosynthesis [Pseudochelatococcus lubricantis]
MQDATPLRLSIVVPVKNEIANIAPLVAEIEAACAPLSPFEIVYVNDGSTDGTGEELAKLARARPHLRILRHDRSSGQSIAVRSGVLAARSPVIATLDGDGQNDPAFIPEMVATLLSGPSGSGLVQGQRVGRKDTGFKRMQSRIANRVRRWILRDATRDTGCGLKVFYREVYLALPFFKALHRFMPALVKREGYAVLLVDVIDRPRFTGTSNYGFFDRLWVGIVDLVGVRWLIARRGAIPTVVED